jgi:hypothetical protein
MQFSYNDAAERSQNMPTLTAENILTLIEQLPADERSRLYRLLALVPDAPAPPKPPLDRRVPCEPMTDRTREFDWIERHKHEYAGQWVALDGDRLLAASPNRMEISAAIKAADRPPLIHRIPSPDDLAYVGI